MHGVQGGCHAGGIDGPQYQRAAQQLFEALQSDEALKREFLSDLEVDGLLQGIGTSLEDESGFARAFFERLHADADASRFIRKVESRIQEEGAQGPDAGSPEDSERESVPGPSGASVRPRRVVRPSLNRESSSSSSWAPLLLAGGILLGLLGLLVLFNSGGEPDRRSPVPRRAEGLGPVATRGESSGPPSGRIPGAEEPRPAATLPPRPETPPGRRPPPGESPAGQNPQKLPDASRTPKEKPPQPDLGEASPPSPAPDPERKATAGAPQESSTQVAIARVEEVSGEVFLVSPGGRTPASAGSSVQEGQGVESQEGRIALRFLDKTRVELGPRSLVAEIRTSRGKRVVVQRGIVQAQVTKQALDHPLVFATPHAEAKVVGTRFRLVVDADARIGTRLEVDEGQVELKNLSGRSAQVGAGQFALAGDGIETVSKPLPIDEILLLPKQARLVGGEWSLAKDRAASGGTALYTRETSYRPRKLGSTWVYDGVKSRPSFLLFSFQADGAKDYRVWIRGRSLPEDPNHLSTAEVAVEVPEAQLSPADAQAGLAADHAYGFSGFFRFPGYGWIGGNGEHPEQGRPDEVPLSIRFPRSGTQTLKIHALQAPAWIDAIWLSATRQTRPEAGQTGPAGK